MKTKRIKLIVAVVGGVLVISTGAWLAITRLDLGFFQQTDKKVVAVINEGTDTDGDGLSDKEERERGTNVYEKDSDGDGYTDGEEIAKGYNPLVVESYDNMDLDGDGLTGADETKYGTDPRLADSDFDGYQDGEEIVSGNNPLSANLSDYVSINAVANASEDGRLSENGTGVDSEGNAIAGNVVEVNQADREQVNYLEQAFSARDVQTFQDSMIGYVQSQDDVEIIAGQLNLPEVSDNDIRIVADTSDEKVRDYISRMSDIFYISFNLQEQGAYDLLMVDGSGSTLIYQLQSGIVNALQEVRDQEVPQDEQIIETHKNIIASLMQADSLSERLGEGNYISTGSQEDVVDVMNDYSELTYLLKTQIIDNYLATLDQIAEKRDIKTNT